MSEAEKTAKNATMAEEAMAFRAGWLEAEAECSLLRTTIAEQAKVIEKLRAENGRLREALRPFSDAEEHIGDRMPDNSANVMLGAIGLSLGSIRRARAAMEGK